MSNRTLGSEVRAARLGFRWLDGIGAYVRIRAEDDEQMTVEIEVRPANDLPRRGSRRPYRVWWEDHDDLADEVTEVVARVVAGGTRIVRVRRPLAFLVDREANFVTWLAVTEQ